MRGYTSMLRRDPLGVVASIAPWNYPLMMAIWKIGPALAAGNTVVLKPSELTPLTALRLAEIAAEMLPPGVLNVITGDGETRRRAGAPSRRSRWCRSPARSPPARPSCAAAADTLKRVHLELGGKAPVIVFDDADLEAVVAGVAAAAYYNAGPGLHRRLPGASPGPRVHDDARERAGGGGAGAAPWATRPTRGPSSGPLVSAEQRDRVAGFVDRAREARRRGRHRRVGPSTAPASSTSRA